MSHRPRLVASAVSPWSERARWALDHHQISHDTIAHVPMLGERRLRQLVARARAPQEKQGKPREGQPSETKKPATVPILITDGGVFCESWDIVVHADAVGRGTRLIPVEHEAAIRAFTAAADAAQDAARALVVAALVRSPQALDETAPAFVPKALRPLLRPVAKNGTLWFARKYQVDLDNTAPQQAALREALLAMRAALAKSQPYLLGAFSYADVVTALVLQAVQPVADRHMPIGPASRKNWTQPALATEFADLLAWRDTLYERHRARV